jgi:hypothetical protein
VRIDNRYKNLDRSARFKPIEFFFAFDNLCIRLTDNCIQLKMDKNKSLNITLRVNLRNNGDDQIWEKQGGQ